MALIGLNVLVYSAELAAAAASRHRQLDFNHGVLFAEPLYEGGDVLAVHHGTFIPPQYSPAGVAHGEWWRLLTPRSSTTGRSTSR